MVVASALPNSLPLTVSADDDADADADAPLFLVPVGEKEQRKTQ